MCGRFAQPRSSDELALIYRAHAAAQMPGEQYNVAPTDEVAAVLERDGSRVVDAFRWGFVPHWAPNSRGAARGINARAETIETSPAYRSAFKGRRCIIPVDAFFEWRRQPDGGGSPRPSAQPFAIERVDGEPMAFAGLWSRWRDPATEARLATVTIVTTIPNELVATLHHRMPVILEPETWDHWLAETTQAAELRDLLLPISADALRVRPVTPDVNDVRNEGPQLLAAWSPPQGVDEPMLPLA